jgi:Tfp pilus assembly protein PilO
MKLKILLVPMLIVIIVILAIWVIYPSVKNMNSNKADLAKAEAKLADIQNKNNQADILAQTLTSNKDKRDTLFVYIPDQKKEEEIISNLNSLAINAGLAVLSVAVSKPEENGTALPNDELATKNSDNIGETGTAEDVVIAPVDFKVTIGVVGGYENIRDLLKKVASLRRFNSLTGLKISKDNSKSGDDQAANNSLTAEIGLTFNYLVENESVANVDDTAFSTGSFNMSVIDDIKNQMNTIVNGLTVGAKGVTNPFVR